MGLCTNVPDPYTKSYQSLPPLERCPYFRGVRQSSMYCKLQVMVSRPHPSPGKEVHHGVNGEEVCGGSHPGPGEDVGGERHPHSPHLLPVHGLRPHQQHRGPGQEAEGGVWDHLHGPGPGGPRQETPAAKHGLRMYTCVCVCV